MTDTSVDAPAPSEQEIDLIAVWGETNGAWLENRGGGHAAVSMWIDGERRTVALVDYDATAATTSVRWNRTGCMAVEQYKRDAWDTRIYSKLAGWLTKKAAS